MIRWLFVDRCCRYADVKASAFLTHRWKVILLVTLATLTIAGCAPSTQEPMNTVALESRTTETQPGPAIPTETSQPTPTSLPDSWVLGIEARWMDAAETALAALPEGTLPIPIQLQVMDPSEFDSDLASMDIVLKPDALGIPVTSRITALAVPWNAEWEHITLEEAQKIVEEGSPFVAVREWSELPPSLKPLRVDGFYPSQDDYPLRQSWSLHARPGLEEVAEQLALILAAETEDRLIQLTTVGDIMLARRLGEVIANGDITYPFAAVQHLLTGADLTIGNLETALGIGGNPEAKGYTFLAPPEVTGSLALAGFDLLSLANNHAMDYGPQTLLQAIELLSSEGIQTVGAGLNATEAYAPLTLEVDGIVLAFLAFVDVPVEVRGFDTRDWEATATRPGVAWADPFQIRAAIEAAHATADVVVVLLHSGYEYVNTPSPPQQSAARLAIDAGADLVIGHHTHVLQGIEFYGEGTIIYGLGNFVFDDGGVFESGLMNIWLDAGGVRSMDFIPLMVGLDGRPIPADPLQTASIRSTLYTLTRTTQP